MFIKKRPQLGGRGIVQFEHFADKWGGGFFSYGRPHFLARKTSDFSKFMICPHDEWPLTQISQTIFT